MLTMLLNVVIYKFCLSAVVVPNLSQDGGKLYLFFRFKLGRSNRNDVKLVNSFSDN